MLSTEGRVSQSWHCWHLVPVAHLPPSLDDWTSLQILPTTPWGSQIAPHTSAKNLWVKVSVCIWRIKWQILSLPYLSLLKTSHFTDTHFFLVNRSLYSNLQWMSGFKSYWRFHERVRPFNAAGWAKKGSLQCTVRLVPPICSPLTITMKLPRKDKKWIGLKS